MGTDEQIIRACAERIMGWRIHFRNTAYWVPASEENDIMEHVAASVDMWNPLTSDADCFELVDALQQREPGWRFSLVGGDRQDGTGWWAARFFGHIDPSQDYGQEHGNSGHVRDRRRAIVLAALKAVGVEINS